MSAGEGPPVSGPFDLDGAGAVYQQIRRALARPILRGEWAPGARIPSEQELTEMFGASRMTINKALSSLAAEGLIDQGFTRAGQIDQGLLFITFQADLEKGFIAVQNRLNGEPLEEYIKPVGGGYFFVLPGVRAPGGYLGQGLVEAVAAAPEMTPL